MNVQNQADGSLVTPAVGYYLPETRIIHWITKPIFPGDTSIPPMASINIKVLHIIGGIHTALGIVLPGNIGFAY